MNTPNDAEAHYNRGVSLQNSKRFYEAEKEFREAIRINPDYLGAINDLGVSLANLNRYEEAEKEWRKALSINPSASQPRDNLNRLLRMTGRKNEVDEDSDTFPFIVAIILLSIPLSVFFVLDDYIIKWWWGVAYYVIFLGLSFVLMSITQGVLSDIGRNIVKVTLIFSFSGTRTIVLVIFGVFIIIRRAIGYNIPDFIWAMFFVFAFVMGYPKFKEREDTFVMLKKPRHNKNLKE